MLEHGPPARPPWRRGYGNYCIKASCALLDADGAQLGKLVAYDRYVGVQDVVENACRLSARDVPGATCTPVQLTLLSDPRKQCAGELYFVVDPSTSRRLL